MSSRVARQAGCTGPSSPPRPAPRPRRGAAVIAVVVLMLVASLVVVGMVLGGARDQELTVRRVETVQSFYAAEGGMNMALREAMQSADEDGDGTIGSISNDGNAANDPQLGVASVEVVRSGTTLTSTGRAGDARRAVSVTLSS